MPDPILGGRPLKFKSSQELQRAINKYFKDCDNDKEPYTITGLAMALGTYLDVLRDYQSGMYDDQDNDKEYKGFSSAIKAAKTKIANYCERNTQKGNIPAAAGIFFAKNYGFTDKTEVDMHVSGSVSLSGLANESETDKDKG